MSAAICSIPNCHREAPAAEAFCAAHRSAGDDDQKAAWLIEMAYPEDDKPPAPRWWHPRRGWIWNANHAIRFAREIDAIDYMKAPGSLLRGKATEHKFIEGAGDVIEDRARMEDALRLIAFLRPAGDVNTAKNARKLVEQMEKIALAALRDEHVTLQSGMRDLFKAQRIAVEECIRIADHFAETARGEGMSEDVVMARAYTASDIADAMRVFLGTIPGASDSGGDPEGEKPQALSAKGIAERPEGHRPTPIS